MQSPTFSRTPHLGWQRLRAALRGGHLAPGLFGSRFNEKIGPYASYPPTPDLVIDVLEDFFAQSSSLDEGRFLCWRSADGQTARSIVTALRNALPEAPGLGLIDGPDGVGLLLRAGRRIASISPEAIEQQTVANDHTLRTVTIDAIVMGTNRLLRAIDSPIRFLPLDSPDDINAFLAVEHRAARRLAEVHLWALSANENDPFASWDRRAVRRAA